MVNKSVLAQRVLYGVARACDFEALGKDEVLAIKRDSGVVHHRFIELPSAKKDAGAESDDEASRTFEDFSSTEHVDGMGDVLKVNGWDLTRLKVGAVPLLWGHDASPVPMGRVLKAKRDKCPDGVRALLTTSVVYEPDLFGDSEWGKHVASILKLMQRGDMPGRSVGFIPKSARWPDKDEREALGMGEWGVVYDEMELYENSVTPIPCNPYANEKKSLDRVEAALREMVEAKSITAEFANWFKAQLALDEDAFIAQHTTRTIVPITKDLPWLKGGERAAAPAARSGSPSESALRALVREEVAAVLQPHVTEQRAATVRIEGQLTALAAKQTPRQNDADRGETEGREGQAPPAERSTGTSREADPNAANGALIALLEGCLRDLKTSREGPDDGRSRQRAVRGAQEEPARRTAEAVATA